MFRKIVCKTIILFVFAFSNLPAISGQENPVLPKEEIAAGTIKLTAWVEIDGKTEKLNRKRFYLIRGNREQNAELLKQIAETEVISRDCYFADLRSKGKNVSEEYICWLKKNDCESTYCREIKTPDEALSVPEFAAAYKTGLREYKQPLVALKWLNTNLPDEIRNGYYLQYKSTLQKLVGAAIGAAQRVSAEKNPSAGKGEGFQSILTDGRANAYFLDVEVIPTTEKKTETYLISNLMPMVFGENSYVWTCEVEVDPKKPVTTIILKTEIGKKKCSVEMKKIPEICKLKECPANDAKQSAANP